MIGLPRSSTVALFCASVAVSPAQTLTTLFNFNSTSGSANALVQGTDGNFYDTTSGGGANNNGSVFQLTPKGVLTTYVNFDGTNGGSTLAGLTLATDGRFYGVTDYGGAANLGTVFSLTALGNLVTLYSFNGNDGSNPWAASLVQGSDGNFYGTTSAGGAAGLGTVFKITPLGALTTLHSFSGSDGGDPRGALVQISGGYFYGTTFSGGTDDDGTVFKIDSTGTFTSLHSFDGTDGSKPSSALAVGADGNLYGTAHSGGAENGGTVFEMTPFGVLTVLYNSSGYFTYGLVRVTNGDLCGVCNHCGNNGSIFRIDTTGAFETVLNFHGATGNIPNSALIQSNDGALYGTTIAGGGHEYGTAFVLDVGLRPFVRTLPAAGEAGSTIRILGNNLTAARSVTFSGTPVEFTIMSSSEILTNVPIGASSGNVVVTTPTETIVSNTPFFIIP